jgi:hypothetical protein
VREQAIQLAQRVAYVELSSEPSFSATFARSLMLD